MKRENESKNVIHIGFLILLVVSILYSFSFAGGGKATMMVTATVIARISQSIVHQERRITLTNEDIKRGFIEIPSGTIVQIKTNDRKGYFLHFEGNNEFFKEVWVIDNGRTTILSSNVGLIHQPHRAGNIEVKNLSYKFLLKENTQAGVYTFPFEVKASLF